MLLVFGTLPGEVHCSLLLLTVGVLYAALASAAAVVLYGVLAALSLVGIFAGILLRVRAFVYLGTLFLLVALFTIIWHAAVEPGYAWLWWVCGIVAGVTIIAVFAIFEKKRDDMLRLVERLKAWEP